MRETMMNEIIEVPGFMMYHSYFLAMTHLDGETYKSVMEALWRLSEFGELPENLNGMAWFAFEMMRPNIARDHERYYKRAEAGRKGGKRSAVKKRNQQMQTDDGGEGADSINAQANASNAQANASNAQANASNAQANASKFKQNQPISISASESIPVSDPVSGLSSSSPLSSAVTQNARPEDASSELTVAFPEKEEEVFPPTREMIVSYLHGKGLHDIDADDFLSRCRDAGWKDGSGRPVKSWRMWLNGYIMKQSAEAVRNRCAPDPRIEAFERLKQRYIREEAQADE